MIKIDMKHFPDGTMLINTYLMVKVPKSLGFMIMMKSAC